MVWKHEIVGVKSHEKMSGLLRANARASELVDADVDVALLWSLTMHGLGLDVVISGGSRQGIST